MFDVFVCQLCIFFDITELEEFQYILDTSSWSDIHLENIFTKYVACFFHF